MKLPPPLQKGDTVALVSPARFVEAAEVEHFVRFASKNGWQIMPDDAWLARHNQFGGTDRQRATHMQAMLDHPQVKAVFCTRGGYGSLRIVDKINFTTMTLQPKWLVGFSDLTVFHAQLQQLGICSLHAPMTFNFGPNDQKAFEKLASFLEGLPLPSTLEPHRLNRNGQATGTLVGGNLSLLFALKGSCSMPQLEGRILFIEDVDEYLYHIDRMMLSLKRAGMLSGLAGLVVGAFTQMKDNTVPFGCTAEEIIREHVADYSYPVCFGFPAGHIHPQQPMLLGARVQMIVNESNSSIEYILPPIV